MGSGSLLKNKMSDYKDSINDKVKNGLQNVVISLMRKRKEFERGK